MMSDDVLRDDVCCLLDCTSDDVHLAPTWMGPRVICADHLVEATNLAHLFSALYSREELAEWEVANQELRSSRP